MARSQVLMSLTALSLAVAFQVQAQGLAAPQSAAAAQLVAESGGNAQVSVHSATGAARFVRAAPGGRLGAARGARATTDGAKHAESARFLASHGQVFGVTDAATELGAPQMSKDRHGGTHISHKQFYKGVPVFGGELKTHFDAADKLTVVNGTFVPGINLNPRPSRSADDAARAATARVASDLGRPARLSAKAPTLMVYRAGLAQGVDGPSHLVWQVEVGNGVDVREFIFLDAHTGKFVDRIAGIHDAKNRRAFNGQGATTPGPNYPNNPFWVEGNPFPTGLAEADNMIAASSDIYDLFKNGFGRDSFDGHGATMDSVFNRGDRCPNASWNGTLISFCAGTTTDDITAHEWGHAYTEYTHNLIYAWQPGALNEAYSDIWGETVDRLNGRGTDTPDDARTPGSCTVFTSRAPSVTISAPLSIAGIKSAGGASFGPQTFGVVGSVVGVDVGAGNAGCNSPFANAAAVAGKIALIDRGTCGFAVKVRNAQDNGAIAVIIGNNQGGNSVINMSGSDPAITIPALSVSQNNGTAIKARLAANNVVTATLDRAGVGTDNSVRWLMGEDSSAFNGAIRDMYNPVCYNNPGKVSDVQYSCGPNTSAGDNGGVHTNSGVPNHAYALLVDGGTYNGQTVGAIGLTKAAHIYYRAQSVYQGPTSNFTDHADALAQSCTDLTGINLNSLRNGAPSGEIISATDCAQIGKAMAAVEMRTSPAQCNFQPMLAQSPPPLCTAGTPSSLMADGFDGGKRGGLRWLLSNQGVFPEFTKRNWGVVNGLPGGRAGYAIFAGDPDIGSCNPGGDESGVQRLDSPEVTLPAGNEPAMLKFDHWVATEAGFDGGNLKISVNGGAWQLVRAADFVYNPYNTTLATVADGNTNPMAGQAAFSGSDGGSVLGTWGRSIVNLSNYARGGDRVRLRFELGNDGCGGSFGWYLDDVNLYRCTP